VRTTCLERECVEPEPIPASAGVCRRGGCDREGV